MTGDVATFGFNLRRKPFDDVKVRRALSYAVDKALIMKAVGYNHSLAANGPLHPTSTFFDKSIQAYPYDPQKAKQLLDEAGYPVKADGFRFSMELTSRSGHFLYTKTNEILADNFKAIGINAKIKVYESAAYVSAMYEKWDFDIAGALPISGFDPHNLAGYYSCSNIKPVSQANFMGYCNPQVEQWFKDAAGEQDVAKRTQIYSQIQKQLVDEAPAIWTIGNVDWVAYRNNFHGLPPGPWNGRDPFEKVWVTSP